MQVLILYNGPVLDPNHPDAKSEHEIVDTVNCVRHFLTEAGFAVACLAVQRNPAVLWNALRRERPDVVFNLFEGLADHGETEAHVAGVLEWLGIPFTGSPYQALCLARTKHITKYLLQGAGLPTPEFYVVEELPAPPCSLAFPVIVKPATQDASLGLDQGSVVTDQEQLDERVAYVLQNFGGPVLVEQFIRGREFSLGLIETPDLRVLPIGEILFTDKDPDFWPIVTYDAKWKPGTRDYESTPPQYPATVAPRLAERLTELAKRAFRLLGCRDYARVDFRVRPSGKPYILEVNPNPDFSPSSGLVGGLASGGITHKEFTIELARASLGRGRQGKKDNGLPSAPRIRKKRALQPGAMP